MKKILYFTSLLIVIMSLLFYLIHYSNIEILPSNYSLNKQKTFLLSTHRTTIFRINKKINIIKIANYPKSKNLEKRGFHSQKWSMLKEKEKIKVIKYLNFLSEDCKCDKTDVSKLITNLKQNKNNFLFSKIGLFYEGEMKNGIDLTYFYFINTQTNTLYAFEMRPNM